MKEQKELKEHKELKENKENKGLKELKGKPVADKIREECFELLKGSTHIPALAILRIGEREEDLSYERGIRRRFPNFGLEVKDYHLPEDCSDEAFQEAFDFLNDDPEINGILLMRPLPKRINEKRVLERLKPEKDLDGITRHNIAGVMIGNDSAFSPCTAQAVVELLKGYDVELSGKHVVILGRSMVVGKPLSMLLLKENATVTICHSKTDNIKEITRSADILISAIGKPRFIGASYVRDKAIVVDVGINTDSMGKLCGDIDENTVREKVSMLSPVPGGVGAVTTAVLARNLVRAYLGSESGA